MAVRRIRYEEGTNTGYKSVEIDYGKNKTKKFSSGNFVKDWYDAFEWYIFADLDEHALINSSSVDHFITDGAPYDSAYLILDGDNPRLEYSYCEDGMEFFVPQGTKPTWEELKILCDNKLNKL